MISTKYKNIYNCFVCHYKEHHVNPWHNITEDELNDIFEEITSSQKIDDDYSFNYLMSYVCKRLGGILDAHTYYYEQYDPNKVLPMNFKIFNNEVLINYPDNLRGFKVISINDITMDQVLFELEKIVTYGTEGRMKQQIEKRLFTKLDMFGLPIFRNSNSLCFKIINLKGEEEKIVFEKEEVYSSKEAFDMNKYNYGNAGTYRIEDKTIIITHSSAANMFTENIQKMVDELSSMDLTNIETIIVDIRGNTGGNSKNNNALMEFLRNSRKEIICLTDYRVFSAGRYALIDLINLGAKTIGSEISTPLNCYGNCNHGKYEDKYFSVSDSYLAPNYNVYARTKEEYKEKVTPEIGKPVFFKPDIYIEQSKEDYINGVDTVLEYALDYVKKKRTL